MVPVHTIYWLWNIKFPCSDDERRSSRHRGGGGGGVSSSSILHNLPPGVVLPSLMGPDFHHRRRSPSNRQQHGGGGAGGGSSSSYSREKSSRSSRRRSRSRSRSRRHRSRSRSHSRKHRRDEEEEPNAAPTSGSSGKEKEREKEREKSSSVRKQWEIKIYTVFHWKLVLARSRVCWLLQFSAKSKRSLWMSLIRRRVAARRKNPNRITTTTRIDRVRKNGNGTSTTVTMVIRIELLDWYTFFARFLVLCCFLYVSCLINLKNIHRCDVLAWFKRRNIWKNNYVCTHLFRTEEKLVWLELGIIEILVACEHIFQFWSWHREFTCSSIVLILCFLYFIVNHQLIFTNLDWRKLFI